MAMRAPDFIWGPGASRAKYADEITAGPGHVPGMRQFALHLRAHMQARLGEFDGALEALGEYRSRHLRELGKEREYAVTANWCLGRLLVVHTSSTGACVLQRLELFERSGNNVALSEAAIGLGEALGPAGSTTRSGCARSATSSARPTTSPARHS